MVTLRQIEYFVELADRRNFGRAAAALNVSQPALSQQFRALEKALGVMLIERSTRSVELTPIGRDLVEQGRAMLLQIRDMKDLAARASDKPVGRIRFGITPTLGPYLMPAVIAHLHNDSPDLRLFVREGIPVQQMAELAEGKLDMMVAPLPVHGDGFTVEPLFREPLHIVAPPDNPLADKALFQETELAGSTFLTLDHRHHYHQQVLTISGRIGGRVLEDYEGTSLDSLRQMAGSGVGLAILPDLYVRSESGGTEMVTTLQPEGWSEHRSIVALWRRNAAYGDMYMQISKLIREYGRSLMQLDDAI